MAYISAIYMLITYDLLQASNDQLDINNVFHFLPDKVCIDIWTWVLKQT